MHVGTKLLIKGTRGRLTFLKIETFPDGLYVWVKERKCAIPLNIIEEAL